MTDPHPSLPPEAASSSPDDAIAQRMAQAQLMSLLPNHRDLYVLAIGLVLGILLGPAVLGKYAPATYEHYFGDVADAKVQWAKYDLSQEQVLQRLAEAQATSVALDEFKAAHAPQRLPLIEHYHQARHNQGRLIATLLGVVIIMVLETLPDPRAIRTRSHLATARYALMAVTLALVLAQPQLLVGISVVYLVLLLAAALTLALVPLARQRQSA